jgi:hypothetical protein
MDLLAGLIIGASFNLSCVVAYFLILQAERVNRQKVDVIMKVVVQYNQS